MEDNSNNSEITKIFQVRPTNEEQNEFVITIGDNLATSKRFKTRTEAHKYIKSKPWDLIFNLGIFVSKRTYEIEQNKEEK